MQMDLQDYTSLLRRTILDGTRFNHLFPKAEKKIKYFEKSTQEELESDVFDTLQFMDEWTRKYSWQVRKFAPLVKGSTDQQTCNNIFRFLHDYFQYKLDNEVQDLHNPASAWANKESGFDCKSFSIFAGALLLELNIPFSFRMAKQKGVKSEQYPYEWIINPNHWTHVYVVVHTNKKNIVIDATTHDNTEVPTIKIHDHKMRHRGLSSPSITGLGCSCTGTPVQKTGLGNPSTLNTAISNFHSFLDVLEYNGIPRTVTNKMIELVKFNIQRGIDPNMSEIMQKAFASTPTQGLGFSIAESGAGAFNQAAGSISVGGSSVTSIGNAISGDPTAIMSIASNVIDKIGITKIIGSTFGAVFANGFNLSCWGASLTPQTAAANIKKYYSPHFTKLSSAIENAQSPYAQEIAINKFIYDVYLIHWYYKFRKINQASWSSCAKKAITDIYQKFFDPLKVTADNMVAELKAKGATVTYKENVVASYTIPKTSTGVSDYKAGTGAVVAYGIPVMNIQSIQTPFVNNPQVISNQSGMVTITNPNGSTTTITQEQYEQIKNANTKTPTTEKSSSGSTLLIGSALILGLKLLL